MAGEAAPALPNALLCLLRWLGRSFTKAEVNFYRVFTSLSTVFIAWPRRSLAEALHLYVLVLALASQSLGGKHSDPGSERRNQHDHSAQPLKPTPGTEKIPEELVSLDEEEMVKSGCQSQNPHNYISGGESSITDTGSWVSKQALDIFYQ